MEKIDFDIDLVYLWVDGNDPEWQARHNVATGKTKTIGPSEDCDGRYANNDELKFSLRSAQMYAPWIRKIFIVTDRQIPDWLDTSNPKVRIVDHTEILPPEALPTFNSNSIEHTLYRIPGLSEHFLYANDDNFFNRPVSPSDFFTADGYPIVRLNRRPCRRLSLWFREKVQNKNIGNYNNAIRNSARLIKRDYGRYINGKGHHNIDSYRKSLLQAVYEKFREDIEPTVCNHLRCETDIQRIIYSYYMMVEKACKVAYVTQNQSFRLHNHHHEHYAQLDSKNPMLFCINDSEFAKPEDRLLAREYLSRRFPTPSQFEKQ